MKVIINLSKSKYIQVNKNYKKFKTLDKIKVFHTGQKLSNTTEEQWKLL